ncbi:MAG: hypothetical protein KAR19_00040 [Bacteroidales bacterium]|nr:hypothetical protein [Bacteroidales bacterium]
MPSVVSIFQRIYFHFILKYFNLWRSVKYDHVYLHPASDGLELYQGLNEYFVYYNHELHHLGIGRRIPADLYKPAA